MQLLVGSGPQQSPMSTQQLSGEFRYTPAARS